MIAHQESKQKLDSLSERERDVLALLAEGMTDREIGERLSISHRTVMKHVSNLLQKLDRGTRSEAAVFLRRMISRRSRE
ncbi:MAG: response regulator transcription factor [Thermomicrobiales bacterium]